MTRAHIEIIFPDRRGFSDDTLHAEVLSTVHPAVIVEGSRVQNLGGPSIAVQVIALFGNRAEVDDHVKRFTNMTGVPSHDVHIVKTKEQ